MTDHCSKIFVLILIQEGSHGYTIDVSLDDEVKHVILRCEALILARLSFTATMQIYGKITDLNVLENIYLCIGLAGAVARDNPVLTGMACSTTFLSY